MPVVLKPHSTNSAGSAGCGFVCSLLCWPLRRPFSLGSGRPPALLLINIRYPEARVASCDFRALGTGSQGTTVQSLVSPVYTLKALRV